MKLVIFPKWQLRKSSQVTLTHLFPRDTGRIISSVNNLLSTIMNCISCVPDVFSSWFNVDCLFNKLISNFLPHLIFSWRTFSRLVSACWWRWWRGWAKNQLWANHNSRNNWYQIARRTVCWHDDFLVSFTREKSCNMYQSCIVKDCTLKNKKIF